MNLGNSFKKMAESLEQEASLGDAPSSYRVWLQNSTAIDVVRAAHGCSNHAGWETVAVQFNLQAYIDAAVADDPDVVGYVSTVQWLKPFLENWILTLCAPTAWAHAKVHEVAEDVDSNAVSDSLLRIGIVHQLIEHLQCQFSNPPLDWGDLRRRVRYPEGPKRILFRCH